MKAVGLCVDRELVFQAFIVELEEELKFCVANDMTVELKAHLLRELAEENTIKLLITVISTEDVWVDRHWLGLIIDFASFL